jgi:hypothetical protein
VGVLLLPPLCSNLKDGGGVAVIVVAAAAAAVALEFEKRWKVGGIAVVAVAMLELEKMGEVLSLLLLLLLPRRSGLKRDGRWGYCCCCRRRARARKDGQGGDVVVAAAAAAAALGFEEMGEVGEVLLLLLPPSHLHLKKEGGVGVAAAVVTALELNEADGHTVPIPFPSLSTLSTLSSPSPSLSRVPRVDALIVVGGRKTHDDVAAMRRAGVV